VTLGMFSDDMLSRIRRKTVFILSLRFVPSLQSAFFTRSAVLQSTFCTDLLGKHVIIPIPFSAQVLFYALFNPVPYWTRGHSR